MKKMTTLAILLTACGTPSSPSPPPPHTSAAPTIAAGPSAGTGAVIDVDGSDERGTIHLTTGTGSTGNRAALFTVTFAEAFNAPPVLFVEAADENTENLNIANGIPMWAFDQAEVVTTGWVLRSGGGINTALGVGEHYSWNYSANTF